MASLRYFDPGTGTYKDVYGPPGPAGPTGPAGPKGDKGDTGVGGGDSEVLINPTEPVPVGGFPELWIDTDDETGSSGALVSGTWGVAPLDASVYGPTDSLQGREIYSDVNGQLRAKPETIQAPAKAPSALQSEYPVGTSTMSVGTAEAQALGWPSLFSCSVSTIRRGDGLTAAQWCYLNSTVDTKAWYRNSSTTGWSAWVLVAGPNELGGSVDLNTITITGTYTQSQSAEATTALNYPYAMAGMLEVTTNYSANMTWQRYTVYPTATAPGGSVYVRGLYISTWQPWRQISGFYVNSQICTGAVTLSATTVTDLTGMTLTVPVTSTDSVFVVTMNYDVQTLLANGSNFVGSLNVGGTSMTQQAVWVPGTAATVGARTNLSQTHRLTNFATTGNVVFKGQASNSVASSMRVNTSHTNMVISQVA